MNELKPCEELAMGSGPAGAGVRARCAVGRDHFGGDDDPWAGSAAASDEERRVEDG
jgi:hypothetical protein